MKTKKSGKKMKLIKITVANLSTREMGQVMGGCPPVTLGCMSIEDCPPFLRLNPGTIDGDV